jgi:iron-sulfur cluster repair protein YtfE (RIC family)
MPRHTQTSLGEPAKSKASTKAGASKKGAGGTSLFDLLMGEHATVRSMFDDISHHKESQERQELFQQLESRLKMHLEKEELFFYPLLEQSGEALVMILKSYEEHKAAKNLLGEFEDLSPDNIEWEAKFLFLRHLVTDHLDSEEQVLFPLAEQELDDNQAKKAVKSIREFDKSVSH